MDFPSLLPAALGSVVKACRSVKRYVVALFRVFVFVKLGTALQNSADRSCPDGSGGGSIGEDLAQTGDLLF